MKYPQGNHQDVAMMMNPARWPHRRILPVKRFDSSGEVRFGVLQNSPLAPVVYEGDYTRQRISTLPKREYESFEALVEDGWMVD